MKLEDICIIYDHIKPSKGESLLGLMYVCVYKYIYILYIHMYVCDYRINVSDLKIQKLWLLLRSDDHFNEPRRRRVDTNFRSVPPGDAARRQRHSLAWLCVCV